MKTTTRLKKWVPLGALGLVLFAGPACASIVMTLTDDGTNMMVSYSGSLDTTAFPPPAQFGVGNFISPQAPQLRVIASSLMDGHTIPGGFTAPFGSGPGSISGFGFTGDPFGFTETILFLPDSYVSGSPLSGSILYPGTIASYGIFPTTVYPIGMSGQTITVNAVPEPAALSLCGLAVLGMTCRRRRRSR